MKMVILPISKFYRAFISSPIASGREVLECLQLFQQYRQQIVSLLDGPMAEQLVYHPGAMPSAGTLNFAGLGNCSLGLAPYTGTRPINKAISPFF